MILLYVVFDRIIRTIGIDGVYMVRESDRAGCVKVMSIIIIIYDRDRRGLYVRATGLAVSR